MAPGHFAGQRTLLLLSPKMGLSLSTSGIPPILEPLLRTAGTNHRPLLPQLSSRIPLSWVHWHSVQRPEVTLNPNPTAPSPQPAPRTHSAFVRLLPRVSPHVHHQHVLGFEGLLLSRAIQPPAHEFLLLAVNMVVVYMLGVGKERKG